MGFLKSDVLHNERTKTLGGENNQQSKMRASSEVTTIGKKGRDRQNNLSDEDQRWLTRASTCSLWDRSITAGESVQWKTARSLQRRRGG